MSAAVRSWAGSEKGGAKHALRKWEAVRCQGTGSSQTPEEQGLERPVARPTAKWASPPALFPNGREFDPSEPSSQAAKQPTSDATDQRSSSLRRCRLRRRGGEAERQSSVDVDVDVLGLPVRVRSWDSFGHGTSDAVVDFLFPPGHAMQAAATRRRMQSR